MASSTAGEGETPAPLPGGLRRAWGIVGPAPNRGPKASLSIDAIVEAAMALGNAEGVDGLSITRVARHLGVTPNALYRYIDSRDELRVLARERALGAPIPCAGSWRWQDRTVVWARALRARYAEHPWLVDLAVRLPLTPNALAWFDALLDALLPGPFDLTEKVRIAVLLDSYVRASAVAARDLAAGEGPIGESQSGIEAIGDLLAERGLLLAAEVFRVGLFQEPPDRTNDADFQFGLDRIIAGIDALAQKTP